MNTEQGPPQLEVRFAQVNEPGAEDPRELARYLEGRCDAEIDLSGRVQHILAPRAEGLLGGGAWEGALLFVFSHYDQLAAFCRSVCATVAGYRRPPTSHIRLKITCGGQDLEVQSDDVAMKDIDKLIKKILQLCKGLARLPGAPSQ